MKYLLILSLFLTGCTTVNIYSVKEEPTIVIKPTIRNMNNPYYDRERN